jgi:hypothetical protein
MTNPDFDITHDKDWLSPLNVPVLANAVKNRQDNVTLTGRKFNITHHYYLGKVFVQVDGNYVPCGWFSYEELEHYEFESDHDKHL